MLKLVAGVVLAFCGVAAAGPKPGVKVLSATAPVDLGTPHVVYLNRCVGGCVVTQGDVDDARIHVSTIPQMPGDHQVSEFSFDDATWDATVACLDQVFSPYNLTFTETRPPDASDWGEHIIAGTAAQFDVDPEFAGYAALDQFCRSLNHPISITFANSGFTFFGNDSAGRAIDICRVASQEIAHTYGLDHIFSFIDSKSSCSDVMTYRFDCGGEKFFRNQPAVCGEYEQRDCRCPGLQNSHDFLTARLGVGTPTTTSTMAITSPLDGAAIGPGTTVIAPGSSDRGLTEVEFRLNGYRWTIQPGAAFGDNGQPQTAYSYTLPAEVPDGVIDIEVTGKDDLGTSSTAKVTVTKGAPCVDATTCAVGQNCDAGRCFWDPPAGEIGAACDYPQFCLSERCDSHDGDSFCTRNCIVDLDGACPAGLECLDDGTDTGYCWPAADGGGCCSSARELPVSGLFGFGVLALVLRRRRR